MRNIQKHTLYHQKGNTIKIDIFVCYHYFIIVDEPVYQPHLLVTTGVSFTSHIDLLVFRKFIILVDTKWC